MTTQTNCRAVTSNERKGGTLQGLSAKIDEKTLPI